MQKYICSRQTLEIHFGSTKGLALSHYDFMWACPTHSPQPIPSRSFLINPQNITIFEQVIDCSLYKIP